MNSRDLFKKTHSPYESRHVLDGAYAVSSREIGQVAGAGTSLKAICSPAATEQDLWHVVHLDAGSRLLLDSVAVLGASGQDQAAEWAMQDVGRHLGAVGVIGVASGSAVALRRVLDDGMLRGRITQAMLDSAGGRVTAHPVRWLDGVGIASHGGSLSTLLLDMVRHDEDGQLLDAMTAADLMEGAEQGHFDALIVDYAHLEMLQNRLAAALSKVAANGLSVSGVTATKPFKRNGVAQVAVMFDFSDGQTFTAFFHNPDSTPAKLAPKDILTSWKFTLNKRDVTAVVQPEQGENVQMPKLASRIMQLVAKNSDRFKRANARKGEMAAQVQEVQARIDQKQTQLAELESDIADLQGRIDERLKAKPVAGGSLTTTQAKNQALDQKIKLVADSVEKVRKQDVQRLLESVDGNTKASRNAARKKMGDYLKAFRPDLAEEVDSVMFDLQEDTFVEADDLARFGQVEITSQGSENIYFTKDGQKYYSKVYNTEQFPKGPFDLAANPNGLKNGKAEEWHTEVPTEGLLELKEEKKKFYDFRLVINRLADDAVKAITRAQKLGNVSLYAYYMPSIPNTGRHGIVRLFPEDQNPGGNWEPLSPQVFHAGMVSDDQIRARLIEPLSKAPVLAHSQQSDTGNGAVSGGDPANQGEPTDAQKIKMVDKAYKFASATDEFKIFAADSQIQNQNADDLTSLSVKAEYDPLSTAVAMDKAAKKQGFKIKWQIFTEPGMDDGLMARVYKENEEVGRISMGSDGKAMVYVGASGDTRVTTPSGIRAMFSDDDAPYMIDWLALHIERERDMNYLKSIVNGTDSPLADESRFWHVLDIVEQYNKPLVDEAYAVAMRIYDKFEKQSESVKSESNPDRDYPQPTSVEPTVQQPVISPEEAALNKELERQAFMKSVNKIVKSKKSDEEKIRLLMENFKVSEGNARELLKPDFAGRIGFPDYELTSVNNKIKRLREKVDFARKHEEMAANGMDDMTISGVDIKMDKEENRLRLYFPEKPSSNVISELRSNGFLWSPRNEAWQRQLNENSLSAAKRVISLYADETGESDDTKDAFKVPNNPEPAPMPEPQSMPTPDRDYLQSIVDGEIDLSDGESVEAELERIGENLTPELEALFERAVDAYAAYQVQQASKIA